MFGDVYGFLKRKALHLYGDLLRGTKKFQL